jgi:hypothetical protein
MTNVEHATSDKTRLSSRFALRLMTIASVGLIGLFILGVLTKYQGLIEFSSDLGSVRVDGRSLPGTTK